MTRTRLLLLTLLAAGLLLPAAAHASPTGVVVSQVYGGGGNAGAMYSNDYVELFNASGASVDLSGWTVQYATSTGTSWEPTALSGTIAPGGHYLVQLASSADVGAALPAADATGTSNLSGTSGKVALVRGTSALTCGAAAGSCAADPLMEDLVGYGAASDFEGSGSAPGLSAVVAATRAGAGCTDTGDNAADFAAVAPAPASSASPPAACASEPPTTTPDDGSASVDLDVAPALAVSVDHPSLSFGSVSFGEQPSPLDESVTVQSNNAAGYELAVARTAFSPTDLPLALAATAPDGGQLASVLAGAAFAAIPTSPGSPLAIGTTTGPSTAAGDVWPTRVGFSSALPLVVAAHYTATVTYTVVAR